jgi:short-subunit dehydrogenase
MSVKTLFDIKDKKALITGGSRGLGLQMAEALGEVGARLAITARKPDELEQAANHLKRLGIEALTLANDLGELEALRN